MLLGLGWGGFRLYLRWTRVPQAVLVLGGSPEREVFAADFARTHPELEVWVSGGSNPEYAEWVFAEAGIPRQRFYLNYDAVDTVTNFTTLVDKLRSQEIRSVYLITSDYHMRRASAIGEIVLGSRDISFRPVSIPSEFAPEPIDKSIRDGVRALVWLATGYTGSTLRERFQPYGSILTDPMDESLPRFGTVESWSEF
ncbi:YdcF family protein [Phormidium yuhuli AB48]|uniref:YdcF family protein n=2 Tax=Phormidium TaxID=1198 RepID=A0ABY5AV47_9CYAN|nr:YdcF family protein [Phormidium yuhuli]USR93163.1 YdcF family protein [Phormidium yuhuli AB48]